MPGLRRESLQHREIPPSFHIKAVRLRHAGRRAREGRRARLRSSLASHHGVGLSQALWQQLAIEIHRRADLFTTAARPDDVRCMHLFPTEQSASTTDAGHDLKLVPNGLLRGQGPRGRSDTGLPVEPGGQPRHLRRGRLLSHGRYRAVPRRGGHPEGTAVCRTPGRGFQARHRHMGGCRARARRVSRSVFAAGRRRGGLRRKPGLHCLARLAEGGCDAGAARRTHDAPGAFNAGRGSGDRVER